MNKDNLNSIHYSSMNNKNENNCFENENKKYNNNYIDAYISIKEMILLLKPFNTVSLNAYLISTSTIPNFIKIIKSLNILDFIIKGKNLQLHESKLRKQLNKYELEKNIKIIYDYNDFSNIIDFIDPKENEFIIVDELFCRTMKIDDYFDEGKKIKINIDRENSKYEIISKNIKNTLVYFEEKKEVGFYKFTKIKKVSEKMNNIIYNKTFQEKLFD